MPRGLLLFAHGARDPQWARPFEAVAGKLRSHASETGAALQVRLAFLEFMQPGLADAAGSLVEAGCERVDVVPLFLGTGGHVRKDLPLLLEQMRVLHPATEWVLRPAVGETAAVIDAMAGVALGWLDAGGAESAQPDKTVTPSSR